MGPLSSKGTSCCPSTCQGHQKQPHMPNTTISQQSLQGNLRERCKTSNEHRKDSKDGQNRSKTAVPQRLPVHSPKRENSNFGHDCNPQRNTRPCPSVHIGNPEMQGRCCLFPKQSHAYEPNTLQQEQRRFVRSPFCNVF